MSTSQVVLDRSALSKAHTSPVGPTPTIVATRFVVGGGLRPHQSNLNPQTEAHKGDTNAAERHSHAT